MASESKTPASRRTMKAVQVHAFGGMDAMIYEDVPLPVTGPGAEFILAAVTAAGLAQLADLIQGGKLHTRVGEVLPLSDARMAHEMLAGRKHRPGKIVLVPAA